MTAVDDAVGSVVAGGGRSVLRVLLVVAVAVTVLVVVAGSTLVLRHAGPITTGQAALIGCGVVLLQDRTVEQVTHDLPPTPLTPLLRLARADGAVEATLLGGFGSRAAPDGDGGCRLLADDEPAPVVDVPPMAPPADDLVVPTAPRVEAVNAGLDPVVLDAAVTGAFVEDVDPETVVRTRAVVVVHRGTVVAERYGDGADETTPLIGSSMTASLADAMVGRLAGEGLLDATDPVPGVWPDDDPRARLTWDDLLTMTSGLEFEEASHVGSDMTEMLFTRVDASGFAADKPLVDDPGTTWRYSPGSSAIICDALTEVAPHEPALMARALVFEPLAMTSATLGTDGDAPVCSSFGYATARDWARLGLLYEQDGVWGGDRLLPAGWVERSTTAVDVPTVRAGRPTPFGRHWWLNEGPDGIRMPSVPADAFWASGDQGQHVVVVPSRDLVVVRLGVDHGITGVDRGLEPLVAGAVAAVDGKG